MSFIVKFATILIIPWISNSFALLEIGIDEFLKDTSYRDLTYENTVMPPKLVVLLGSSGRISCGFDTNLNITWTTTNSSRSLPQNCHIDVNGDLIIPEITKSDEGIYLCIIQKGESHLQHRAVLASSTTVFVAEESNFWKDYPTNMSVPQGSVIRLKCSSSFFDEYELCVNVKLRWFYNDKLLMPIDKHSFPKCGVLHLTNVTETDAGSYRCEAKLKKTGHTFHSVAGHIDVLLPHQSGDSTSDYKARGYLPPSPPVLLFNTENRIEAIVGDDVSMECFSNDIDNPRPVVWRKKVGNRRLLLREEGIWVQKDGTLVITNVRSQDRGSYHCKLMADSDEDMGYRMFRLQVLHPPVLMEFPYSMHFVNGPTQRFNCSASGVPRPIVSIYRDGRPLVENQNDIIFKEPQRSSTFPNTTISFARFIITQKKHEGVYQCVAQNAVGFTTKAIKLTVSTDINTPELPFNITIKESNATSILYTWQPSPCYNSSIYNYNYHLFFGVTDKPHNEVVLESKVLERRYSKLEPDIGYSFFMRVLATDNNEDLFMSVLSGKIYHRTNKQKTVTKKMQVRVSYNDDENGLRAEWRPAEDSIEQRIQWWTKGFEEDKTEKVLASDMSRYDITGIDPAHTEVRIWVKKYSSGDDKDDTEENSRRTPVKDRLRLHLMSNDSTSVLIDWTLPGHLKNNREFHFNLTFISAKDANDRNDIVISSFCRPYWVTGIDPGCYRFLLLAQPLHPSEKVKDRSMVVFCTFVDINNNIDRVSRVSSSSSDHLEYDPNSIVKVSNITSSSMALTWNPVEDLNANFYLVIIDELEQKPDKQRPIIEKNDKQRPIIVKENSLNTLISPRASAVHVIDLKFSGSSDVIKKRTSLTVTKTEVNLEQLVASATYKISVAPCTANGIGSPLITPIIVATLEGGAVT